MADFSNPVESILIDRLFLTNISQKVYSKGLSGSHLIPNWLVNEEVGLTGLGTPYYDSVKFKLDDLNETPEFIESVISISNLANISKTYINGRKSSVKQITGFGDYEITFNIKLVSPHTLGTDSSISNIENAIKNKSNTLPPPPYTEVQKVGIGGVSYKSADYVPNTELRNLINFFNIFYANMSYKNIEVKSLYLNNAFGITNIVPYSISTQQNIDSTNTYNIVIAAYSDFAEDTSTYSNEIIPL